MGHRRNLPKHVKSQRQIYLIEWMSCPCRWILSGPQDDEARADCPDFHFRDSLSLPFSVEKHFCSWAVDKEAKGSHLRELASLKTPPFERLNCLLFLWNSVLAGRKTLSPSGFSD